MAEDVHRLLEYLTANNLMRTRFPDNSTSIACRRQHATPCRSVIMSCMRNISNIEPDESLAQAKSLETQKLIEDWSATFLPDQSSMQRQRQADTSMPLPVINQDVQAFFESPMLDDSMIDAMTEEIGNAQGG